MDFSNNGSKLTEFFAVHAIFCNFFFNVFTEKHKPNNLTHEVHMRASYLEAHIIISALNSAIENLQILQSICIEFSGEFLYMCWLDLAMPS